MRNSLHLLALCLLTAPSSDGVSLLGFRWTPAVEIGQGKLRGVAEETHDKYLGIPYATVAARFQAPGAPPSWNNTFDAIQGRSCSQLLPFIGLPLGSEDCLILNVYVPKNASPDQPAPVMVFIHGGGFFFGGSSSLVYGPEPLVEKGVVVVTITYRLGAFGFLCLGLEGAPGNAGLKDQLAALRWVNKNIQAFGGDPTSVTIFGESAGAVSVHLLVLSKATEGLFHRAILQSNSALSPFSIAFDPVVKSSIIAEKLGFSTVDPGELLQIYQNTSVNAILNASNSDEEPEKYSFRPCIEKEFPGVEPFLTESPHAILRSGKYNKVPMIIGYNNKEGLLFVGILSDELLAKADANFEALLPENLSFQTIEEKKAVAKIVKKFYFGDQRISRKTVRTMMDFSSDAFFHVSGVMSTELHLSAQKEPVFNYYFKYDSITNIGKLLGGMPLERGATHADEIYYLFQPSLRVYPLFGRDRIMSDRMTEMWTDFAKKSNPTPSTSDLLPNLWTASNSSQLQFYSLGDAPHMRPLPNPLRINFWKDLYDKYGIR